jgi:hypothetical protein
VERTLNVLPPYPLWGAEQRARRANIHITALERRLWRWFERNAQTIVDADDPAATMLQVGGHFIRKSSLWIGDAVYNLRGALDYIVYDFATLASGEEVKNTQFPICNSEADFEAMLTGIHPKTKRRVTRRLDHVPAPVVERFRQLQPCATPPCEWTRVLRELSNPDKHRSLTSLRAMGRTMRGDHPELPADVPRELRTAERFHFVAHIYFKGTEVDVIETLKVLQRTVRALIEEFKPAFKWTGDVFQIEYEPPAPPHD